MARVRMIKPEEADADTRKVYDGVREQWGRISHFSQVLAHQPAALAGVCGLSSQPRPPKLAPSPVRDHASQTKSEMMHGAPAARSSARTQTRCRRQRGYATVNCSEAPR